MRSVLKAIETPFIDAQTLLGLLAAYKKPREAILRMVKNKELIRLRNGFYLINEKITESSSQIIPFEQVANLLYGPSYVSMQWALSFYGMIPERVHVVTSMTLGRQKDYHTPVGDFLYLPLSSAVYPIGVLQKKSADFVGSFLIASPEKALADMVFKTCKGLDKAQLEAELFDSKRMDRHAFLALNQDLLQEIAIGYHAKHVYHLLDLARGL